MPLLNPIQNPLPRRIRAMGLLTAIGHPLFFLLWRYWSPQPYEELEPRLTMSALGLVLAFTPALYRQPQSTTAAIVTYLIFWLTLPVFFTWMYLCNLPSAIWFASAAAMLLIYMQLTDWRLATLGLVTGLPAGSLLFRLFGPDLPPIPSDVLHAQGVVFVFCAATGLTLGMSSANLRREQLKQALDTMSIMAHELRTPLASMSLIGEALRQTTDGAPATLPQEGEPTQRWPATPPGPSLPPRPSERTVRAEPIEQLAQRLLQLVRQMHRQIDTQIINARLLRLPDASERVGAAALLSDALDAHPYRHRAEHDCVELVVRQDFEFETVRSLFLQVIDNLLRNAFRALSSLPGCPQQGDLRIEVSRLDDKRGCIRITDRGPGIPAHLLVRLFQPFVSSHHGSGHGLGLAFCHRVVHKGRGRLRAESVVGEGATFIIELPLAPPIRTPNRPSATSAISATTSPTS